MTGMTHTPFPWRLEINDQQTEGNIWGPDGEHVENCDLGGTFQIDGKAAFERELGDLHIKAAAPDMLEALTMVRDADEDCKADGLPTIPDIPRAKIDNAIAKARGQA